MKLYDTLHTQTSNKEDESTDILQSSGSLYLNIYSFSNAYFLLQKSFSIPFPNFSKPNHHAGLRVFLNPSFS